MPKPEEIQKKLREFNLLGFSDPNTKYLDNGKNGTILTRKAGDWKYEDEFYGGEPYCGNETIWYKNQGVFRCVYWGKVVKDINFSDIYSFLRKALSAGPNGSCVHRGPESFSEGELIYKNSCVGNIEEFVQTERIYLGSKGVYVAYFIGGRVNVQKE